MVTVPAGKFLMGSPEGQGEAHEQPQREVFVPEVLMDKTEVTWRQYKKFAEAEEVSTEEIIRKLFEQVEVP